MCGITGFWNFRADQTEDALNEQIRCMADTLAHRGPDDWGTWFAAEDGVALGFRRLAILDLSPNGHQPMRSADGRYVIVFNGEIYNYRELRKELQDLGHAFRGTSDTEVILAGCSQWGGEAVIPRLWGMFAIAIWDRHEKTLLLARDRLGKKPLYFGQVGGTLLFGSELKALLAHTNRGFEIDRASLSLYVRYGYIPEHRSIYSNIYKLPPGHLSLIRPGQAAESRPYWEAKKIAQEGLASRSQLIEQDAIASLDALLRDAVQRRMIADVPLGAFLSGGIDSSTIVALMQAQSSRPVKTFSIGFQESAYNEAEAAAAVAHHLGTEHTELYVTPDQARSVIPLLPELYDEPFADSSQIPTFLVSQLARQHVTVSLSGDGGDELFAGYTGYQLADQTWSRLRHIPRHARHIASRAIQSVPTRQWDAMYATVEPVVPAGLKQAMPGDQLYKLARVLGAADANQLHHQVVSIWKNPANLVLGSNEPSMPLLDPALNSVIPNFTERMMYLDLVTYLPDDILVKVDRASMGVSLEARCPLLDHRVVEFAWQLPVTYKRRNGQGKWILRQVLYKYVPPTLVERPKMGFGVPIDSWLRGPLKDWAESLLDETRIREEGYFNPEPIRTAWDEHLRGSLNHQHRLWAILMFQAWKQRWLNHH